MDYELVSLALSVDTMRSLLPLILPLAVATFVGCSRAPHFEFTDQTQITFTNRNPTVRDGLLLGPSSRASFLQTLSQPEADFDPKLLQLSAPMGVFRVGDKQFEYHLGLVVYRVGRRAHIWQSDFSNRLGDALLKTNSAWKEMLER